MTPSEAPSDSGDDGAIDPERLARRDEVLLRLQLGAHARLVARAAAPDPVASRRPASMP